MLDLYYFYLQDLQIKRNHQTSHGWDISAKPSWHLLATCRHKLQKCFHKAERLPLLNYLMLVCFDNYLFVWVYLLVQGVKSLIHICQDIFFAYWNTKGIKNSVILGFTDMVYLLVELSEIWYINLKTQMGLRIWRAYICLNKHDMQIENITIFVSNKIPRMLLFQDVVLPSSLTNVRN